MTGIVPAGPPGGAETAAGWINFSNPLGRLGEVEDIAGAVSSLAGPDGGWVNGRVLRAKGALINALGGVHRHDTGP